MKTKYYQCKKCGQRGISGVIPKCECACCGEKGYFEEIKPPIYMVLGQIDGEKGKSK
jgi:hypothetical protein